MTFIENGLTYTVENGFLIVEKDGAEIFYADISSEVEPTKEDVLKFADFIIKGVIS